MDISAHHPKLWNRWRDLSKLAASPVGQALLLWLIFAAAAILVPRSPENLGAYVPPAGPSVEEKVYHHEEKAPPEPEPDSTAPPPVPDVDAFGIVRRVPEAGKLLALTFDDGPVEEWTLKYLQVLREERVPATFFVIGSRAKRYPHLTRAIAAEGHELASHSYYHARMAHWKKERIASDIRSSGEIIHEITGQEVRCFRPPYGQFSARMVEAANSVGQTTVMWSIDPWDWNAKTPEQIINGVIANLRPGSIILLHEGKEKTAKALPEIIKQARTKGYEFVTLSELLAKTEDKRQDEAMRTQHPPVKLETILTYRVPYGNMVEFEIRVRNAGRETIRVTLPSSQDFDLEVLKEGKKIWRWSDGKAFTMALREVEFAPGHEEVFSVFWCPPGPGEYLARAYYHGISSTVPQVTIPVTVNWEPSA